MPPPPPIEVLVIDDSAVVRQVLRGLLEEEGDFRVVTAADPVIALSKIEKQRPDVIVLDIVMPRMDGLTFLARLRETDRIPVVICSGHVAPDSERALRALQLGATEIVSKPRIGIQQFLQESRVLIADAVRAARQMRPRRTASPSTPSTVTPSRPAVPARRALPTGARSPERGAMASARDVPVARSATSPAETNRRDVPVARSAALPAVGRTAIAVIALGASTGGPQALEEIFQQLPPDCPGIVAVQHMPAGFTRAFAKRLDSTCRITVQEAENGALVTRGRALIAPGDHHLLVHRNGSDVFVEVTSGPLVSRHRPSVNVLFRSVAVAVGTRAIGVLMTGMGDDGAEGLLEMRRAGAHTIAQDRESSAVFGMPGSAIECGAAAEVVGLDALAARITDLSRLASWRLSASSERT